MSLLDPRFYKEYHPFVIARPFVAKPQRQSNLTLVLHCLLVEPHPIVSLSVVDGKHLSLRPYRRKPVSSRLVVIPIEVGIHPSVFASVAEQSVSPFLNPES